VPLCRGMHRPRIAQAKPSRTVRTGCRTPMPRQQQTMTGPVSAQNVPSPKIVPANGLAEPARRRASPRDAIQEGRRRRDVLSAYHRRALPMVWRVQAAPGSRVQWHVNF
jgi:hypothetical protein